LEKKPCTQDPRRFASVCTGGEELEPAQFEIKMRKQEHSLEVKKKIEDPSDGKKEKPHQKKLLCRG